jgi:4'-phosphopantetheinyl transferase
LAPRTIGRRRRPEGLLASGCLTTVFMTLSGGQSILAEPGDIHLWRAWLEQEESVVQAMKALLTVDERVRAENFRLEEHRRRFVLTRGLLRKTLAHYLAVHPAALEIRYGSQGKPFVPPRSAGQAIHFSVAHSAQIAFYGVSFDHSIGVDVEWVRPIPFLDEIARWFFCPAERLVLQQLSGRERIEPFFEFWTRKEAYLKARGCGLTGSLCELNRWLDRNVAAEVLDITEVDGTHACWSFPRIKPAPPYVATIAVEGCVRRLVCRQWQGFWPHGAACEGKQVWHTVPDLQSSCRSEGLIPPPLLWRESEPAERPWQTLEGVVASGGTRKCSQTNESQSSCRPTTPRER